MSAARRPTLSELMAKRVEKEHMAEKIAVEALVAASRKPDIPYGLFLVKDIVGHGFDIYGKIWFITDIYCGKQVQRIAVNTLGFTCNNNHNEIFLAYVKKHDLSRVI